LTVGQAGDTVVVSGKSIFEKSIRPRGALTNGASLTIDGGWTAH